MEVGKEAAVLVVQQGGWKTWSCLAAWSHLSLCNAWVCLQCIYGPGIFTSILYIAHTFDAHTFEQQMLSVVLKAPINCTLFLSVSLGFFFSLLFYIFNFYFGLWCSQQSHSPLSRSTFRQVSHWWRKEKKNRGRMMEEKQKRHQDGEAGTVWGHVWAAKLGINNLFVPVLVVTQFEFLPPHLFSFNSLVHTFRLSF